MSWLPLESVESGSRVTLTCNEGYTIQAGSAEVLCYDGELSTQFGEFAVVSGARLTGAVPERF